MPTIGEVHPKGKYYLGVDFARMGQDSSCFIVVEDAWNDDVIRVVYIEETKHKLLTDAIGRVILLNHKFKFSKIYLDTTGLGAGPGDVLAEKLGGKVEQITFTSKSKQDIYSNLKVLMDKGKLKLPNNKKLLYELMDLRYEITSSGNMKIHHSERGHDDYCDALALACYHFKPRPRFRPLIG